MGIASRKTLLEKIKEIFLKGPKPFIEKREVNWFKVQMIIASAVVVLIVGILVGAAIQPQEKSFHEPSYEGDHDPKLIVNQSSTTPVLGRLGHPWLNFFRRSPIRILAPRG